MLTNLLVKSSKFLALTTLFLVLDAHTSAAFCNHTLNFVLNRDKRLCLSPYNASM